MDTLVKINQQTAGRDKIARLLQYFSRVVWNRLQTNDKQGVDRLKSLEYQLSAFRKLLRFGRCVDVLYSTLPLFQYSDSTVRVTLILSKISNSLFLLADHLLWLGRADLCNIDIEKWGRFSNKYWLLSITLNLVRDFYEITKILKANKNKIVPVNGCKSVNDCLNSLLRALVYLQQNRAVVLDTIKNSCDFFIPLNALGHVKLNAGTIGWLGVISSLAGLLPIIEPLSKLTPA